MELEDLKLKLLFCMKKIWEHSFKGDFKILVCIMYLPETYF